MINFRLGPSLTIGSVLVLKDLPVITPSHGISLVINTNNLVTHYNGQVKKEFVRLSKTQLEEMAKKCDEVERRMFEEAHHKMSSSSSMEQEQTQFSPPTTSTPLAQLQPQNDVQQSRELEELFAGLDEDSIFGEF